MASGRSTSFARFLAGLPRFLRHPVTPEGARRVVSRLLAGRESNFLRVVREAVYGHRSSPYVPLLGSAGCEYGDLEAAVRRDGLETALRSLRNAGVYITFEEFKGREPIVRDGVSIRVRPGDFDNPLVRGGVRSSTGGSTGESTPVFLSLPYLADRATSMVIGFAAHGVLGMPSASVREPLPAPSLGIVLEDAHVGQVHERWFAPSLGDPPFALRRHRMAHTLIEATARLAGVRLPHPEPMDVTAPAPVLRWAREQGSCMIRTSPSYALRVCLAADGAGLDLAGVVFVGAGEPVTPGKIQAITRTGARWVSNYAVSEMGRAGIGCARPVDATDVHFLEHAVALIQHPRQVPGWDGTVDSFHFTTLLESAPKVLLNVETDDFGTVEERSCGCPLEEVGFGRHIRQIFSYRKLTGEGVSLLGSDALHIIDEVLPARFGGSPADYQFVEEEDERGLTRLVVVVSPRLSLPSEVEVAEAVLQGLGATSAGASIRSVWRNAETIRVRREEPEVSSRGKLRPIVSRRIQGPP